MNKLFLDDVREAWNPSWVTVRNAADFKSYIEIMYEQTGKIPDVISFDHDLADEHYNKKMYNSDHNEYDALYDKFKIETGLDCAKWLCMFCVDNEIPIPEVNIHSMNPVGAKNIAFAIMNYKLFYYEEELNLQPRPYRLGPPEGF